MYEEGFWEKNEDYIHYKSKPEYQNQKKHFRSFYASWGDDRVIEYSMGRGYPANNAPTYPQETIINIRSEGYTREEINDAIYQTLKRLGKQVNQRTGDNHKDFFILKSDNLS